MNQAFFNRILVTEDGVSEWEYHQPFALLMAAHGAAQRIKQDTNVSQMTTEKAKHRASNNTSYRRSKHSSTDNETAETSSVTSLSLPC